MTLTIQDLVLHAADLAKDRGAPEIDLITLQHLAQGIFGIQDVDWIQQKRQAPESPALTQEFEHGVKRLLDGMPLAYILGDAWFRGRQYTVSPAVLIPRPETELLAEACIERISALPKPEDWLYLECGAGSGVLSIELALAFPDLRFNAWELSPEAALVCQENIDRHHIRNISLFTGDFFEGARAFLDQHPAGPVFIYSNPPYIESQVIETLDRSVTEFEPKLALDGGLDGLSCYRGLFELFQPYRGVLACEFGYNQRAALETLAKEFALKDIQFYTDYAQLDRYFIATRH